MQHDEVKVAPPSPSPHAPAEPATPAPPLAAAPPAPVAPVAASADDFAVPAGDFAASAGEALRTTQENMVALQRLQQQTAQLHQLFLEGQNSSQQHYHTLLQQYQRFVDMCLGLPAAPAAPGSPAAPAPVARSIATPTHTAPALESPAPVAAAPAPVAIEAPSAPPVVAESAPAPVAACEADLAKILLDIVAEKTGYPADVLELGMELEADLGIDSIKRVEILSALQDELPSAPEVGADQLGTLRTLQSLLDLIPGETAVPLPAPVVQMFRNKQSSSVGGSGSPTRPESPGF